ncbi:hypothetical protein [Ancylomarina longa]|uniref:Uncharacterized protein n=1 Tax=Ancylomarina longa TaxID=2487017 RepID=A0A434AYU8_9BACT|nr:hypothetical protein [Ancylomarina longa]RUT79674.1 hypothetical protein DLK05_03020 [Ancylomarina longa]
MSDQQNLIELNDEIKTVSNEEILFCNMPYKVFIDEAEDIHTRASIDLPLLSPYGLKAEALDKLLAYTGALRAAQSNWETKNTDKENAVETWNAEAPEMYNLKEDLIDNMEFAYRANENLLNKLKTIKEGNSRADTIQDMASLSVLGKDNPAPLVAIGFDITLCDKAAEMADRMGTLLGDINGRMYFDDELKIIRDKAYTLTKKAIDEIRSYGKFVFRKDLKKLQAYASKYHRERQQEYRKQKKMNAEYNKQQISD